MFSISIGEYCCILFYILLSSESLGDILVPSDFILHSVFLFCSCHISPWVLGMHGLTWPYPLFTLFLPVVLLAILGICFPFVNLSLCILSLSLSILPSSLLRSLYPFTPSTYFGLTAPTCQNLFIMSWEVWGIKFSCFSPFYYWSDYWSCSIGMLSLSQDVSYELASFIEAISWCWISGFIWS